MGNRIQPSRHTGRHRRRGGSPMPLILLLALVTVAGMLLYSCARENSGEPEPDAADPGGETSQTDGGETDLPEETEETDAPADPYEGYTLLTMTEADMGVGEQILVSNEHHYDFPEAAESQLVLMSDNKSRSYVLNTNEMKILPVTVEHLNALLDDYLAQGGATDIMVVSGYRTYDFQQGLFDRNAANNGIENARRYVAQAGGSEHHTGYAVDLYSLNNGDYFEGVGEYQWVVDHCKEYGFILRYTEEKEPITKIAPESWHFRYVGVPHSYLVTENDFCYEEYIDYLRQFPFDGEHLTCTVDGTDYEIYFVEGLEVPVPEGGEYTVSGNNVDGFIVTVTK